MEPLRHPGAAVPHFVEPVLGLAEGETRGLNAGYGDALAATSPSFMTNMNGLGA
jgi:hypothetical protein